MDMVAGLYDNQGMPSDRQVAVRLTDEQIKRLDEHAALLSRATRRRITRSDVVRVAVEAYIKGDG
jgi:predicted DNA-binding protein